MLAERDLAQVLLYDPDQEKARYLASDLGETMFGSGFNNRVTAAAEMKELVHCDVVLVAAGARKEAPTSTDSGDPAGRKALEELFQKNHPVIRSIAETFTGTSTLFVVASEPVDLLTADLALLLRVPFSRVLGVGGVLDAYRVRHLLSEEMQFNPDFIRSQVMGPHDHTVVPLWDYTSINGVPVRSIVDAPVLESVERSLGEINSGGVPPGSSSRYTPAVACVDLLDAVLRDDRRILSTTVAGGDVFGCEGVAMGVPCIVGRLGAERLIAPALDDTRSRKLKEAAVLYGTILKGADA